MSTKSRGSLIAVPLRVIAQTPGVLGAVLDERGFIRWASDANAAFNGMEVAEMVGQHAASVWRQYDPAMLEAVLAGTPLHGVSACETAHGRSVWLSRRWERLPGRKARVLVVAVDVSAELRVLALTAAWTRASRGMPAPTDIEVAQALMRHGPDLLTVASETGIMPAESITSIARLL